MGRPGRFTLGGVMDKHITVIAVLFLVFGFLGLMAAAIVFIAVTGGGLLSGDPEALFITSTVATAIAGFLGLTSLPEIIAGFALLARKKWSRLVSLIVAALGLLKFPIGTLVGIYVIWVMLQDETIQYLNN